VGAVTVAEHQMWTKLVPMDVWALIVLCVLLLALLHACNYGSFKESTSFVLIVLFLNSFLKLTKIVWRQSWSHKWKLLGVVELLLSMLLSLYENSITFSVVVPLVPEPFLNTRQQLYDQNYTFFAQEENSRVARWLCDEYTTVNHPRVLAVPNLWRHQWLERYFFGNSREIKFAIAEDLLRNYHFRAVKFLKEKNDTCYQMYPTEEGFHPEPFYFTFASTQASLLSKGVWMLQAHGFTSLYETAKDFRVIFAAADYTSRVATEYYVTGVTFEELGNNKLKQNMITMGNIKSVLYVGLIVIGSAVHAFFIEVFSKEIVFMMLTKSN